MLLKRLIFIFTLFISSSVFSSKITYEDFIHMNKSQKIQTIRLIHKFLNEYETQSYILRTKKSKKYSEYKKILDYFISSAYANDISTNQTYRNNRCFYAGWISITKIDKDNNSFCIHPRRLGYGDNIALVKNNTGSDEVASYYQNTLAPKYKNFFAGQEKDTANTYFINLDKNGNVTGFTPDSNNCSDGENIACNPEVYGQDEDEGTLCVKSGGNNGVNASYTCDKALDHMSNNNPARFDQHMKYVIDNMLSNKDSASVDLLKMMYDICLCKGEKSLIQTSYADKIFGTRTCAGILGQTDQITQKLINRCKEHPNSLSNLDNETYTFLINANKVINEQVEKIRTLPFPEKHNSEAKRQKVIELIEKDKEIYETLSEEHYQRAKENFICSDRPMAQPTSNDPTNTPPAQGEDSSISVSFDGYIYKNDNLYSKLSRSVVIDGNEVTKDKLKQILYTPALITLETGELSYSTKTPQETTSYNYQYNERDLKGEGLKLSPPQISCELNLLEDKKMIELTPNTSEIEGFDLNNHLNKVSIELISDDKKIESEQVNENPLTLKLKELDSTKTYTANGSIKLKSINLSFTCQNEVQTPQASSPPEEKEELIKSCKLKLKREVDQNGGYKVSASMEYFKDKDGKEQIDPTKEDHKETFSNFKTSLTWFDLGFPANEKKKEEKKQDKTENTADVLDLSDESEKKEEEKEKKKKKSAFELLGEKYHTYKGKNGKEWRGTSLRNVPPQAADRKVSAYIKFSGDGVPKACKDQYQSIMIPAFGASNNSPVQQNLINTNIERPRGGMPFQMQR